MTNLNIGKFFIKEIEAVEESPINWLHILNPAGTPGQILEIDIETHYYLSLKRRF
jgi:hypothetical protein